MKKQKIQKQSNPISLSAKKIIPKHQQLFTPYKIQWKDTKDPLKNMDNATNTKHFYSNMKSQLMNIKNDVAKMMRRQGQLFNQNGKTPVKTINIKNKCQVGLKKQKDSQFLQQISKNSLAQNQTILQKIYENQIKEQYESVANNYRNRSNSINGTISYESQKQTNPIRAEQVQVNLKDFKNTNPQNSKSKTDMNKFVYLQKKTQSKEQFHYCVKQKEDQTDLLQQSYYTIRQNFQQIQKTNNEDKCSKQLKLKIESLQNIICSLKEEYEAKQSDFTLRQSTLTNTNQKLYKQIQELKLINSEIKDKRIQQERQINFKLDSKDQYISKLQKNNNQILSQRQYLKGQLDRLMFYTKNLEEDHFKQRNHIQCIQGCIQQLKMQSTSSLTLSNQNKPACNCQKLQIVESQIIQCKKREQMLLKDLQKYSELQESVKLKDNKIYLYQSQLSNAKQQLKRLKNISSFSDQRQNDQENVELKKFSQQLQAKLQETNLINSKLKIQSEQLRIVNQTLKVQNQNLTKLNKTQKIGQLLSNSSNQQLGNQISAKFNQYIDQNYKLKNQMSHLRCKVEQLQLKNNLLNQQITLYQTRSSKNDTARLAIDDWERINQELQNMTIQKESLLQKNKEMTKTYELQLMSKQNIIAELKVKLNNDQLIGCQHNQMSMSQMFPNLSNATNFLQSYKNLLNQCAQLKQSIKVLKLNESISLNKQKQLQSTIKFFKTAQSQNQKEEHISKLKQQIDKKNNYIRNVLIDKIHKDSEQDNIDYYFSQLEPYFT